MDAWKPILPENLRDSRNSLEDLWAKTRSPTARNGPDLSSSEVDDLLLLSLRLQRFGNGCLACAGTPSIRQHGLDRFRAALADIRESELACRSLVPEVLARRIAHAIATGVALVEEFPDHSVLRLDEVDDCRGDLVFTTFFAAWSVIVVDVLGPSK